MLTCAIDSLCHNNTKPYEKAVASDHLYSLVSPSFISPLLVEVAKENQKERAKLIEACSLSQPDKEIIRREVRCKN
ncbi:unnamed protein product [Porites lobata]|uniref:Uncharacterized protein n=1 Tax=Porites lobata TaxID=104759 RepID=A0ABN8SGX5_9CNID|nr:unnamed protein product [Porites lobata]